MIIGERIRLRAIEAEDLPLLVQWRNDPEVYRCFYEHEPLSLAKQRLWYQSFLQRPDEKYWIAETHPAGEAVGTIALVNLDWRNRRAELGRVLVAPGASRRSGFGREICRLALDYAFRHLNLHRVYLEVFADNEAAVGLYRRLGFREEGCLRQHVFAEGAYRDVLLFAMLAGDFRGDLPEA
jgi:UDP-4-amino-4,6-dideoxy-N-acetyl-beta-L-altrosamine N-acetyltransferase